MPPGPAFKNKPVSGPAAPSFPSDGSDVAFAALVQLVRAGLHGSTVRAWDDPADDGAPPGGEGPPWVRLTPEPAASKLYCRTPKGVVHRMPLTVHIETSIAGRQVGQSQKLWGAILRAIFPGPTMPRTLQSAGVSRIAVAKAAWAAPMPAKGDVPAPARIEAVGSLELLMQWTTPE